MKEPLKGRMIKIKQVGTLVLVPTDWGCRGTILVISTKKELHGGKRTFYSSELVIHRNIDPSQGHSEFTERKGVCSVGNLLSRD